MNDLFKIRKELGYSRQKAAKLSGVSYGTIYRIEHDSCDVGHRKIAQLQQFYEVELGKVLNYEADN